MSSEIQAIRNTRAVDPESGRRKLRVCHISTRFLRGGGTKNTLYTLRGLDTARYELALIVGRDVFWDQMETISTVRVFQVPSLRREINPILDPVALLSIYRLIRRHRYDIVHTHTAKAGMLGRWAARLAGTPLIVHGLHGTTFHPGLSSLVRRIFVTLERVTGSFTDSFISVGEDLRDRYLQEGIASPDRYAVVRSGMELDEFFEIGAWSEEEVAEKRRELGLDPHAPVIGYVANLEPRKAHVRAIEVVEELIASHPRIQVLFVGEGFHRNALEEMVAGRGLEDHIFFTGYRKDIAEVIGSFDIKIFTSQWEGLPQVLVQSAAAGKPIVSFEVEGVREVVHDGVNGFVVSLNDGSAMVDRIRTLLDDLDEARTMGGRGPAIIGDEWLIETMVERTAELYERLLKDAEAPLAEDDDEGE